MERLEVGDQGVVDLAGQVALDTTPDLRLGAALVGAPLGIGAGAWAPAHADHDRQMQRPVGVAVTATVQPMAMVLPELAGDRRDPAQVGEGGLSTQPLGVLAGSDQQLPSVSTSIGGSFSSLGAGGGLGVDRVGLAALAAGAPVWPVDLHRGEVLVQQVAGQASAVAARAFDPDGIQASVPAKPAQQLPIAATVSGEPPVAEQPSLLVDDGGVVGAAVVSTPPMTTRVPLGMLVSPFRSGTSQDSHAPAGRADTPVMGLERTSSYQSRYPRGTSRRRENRAIPSQAGLFSGQVTPARPLACTSGGPVGQADSSRDD